MEKETLLAEAKRRYPKGTKFLSALSGSEKANISDGQMVYEKTASYESVYSKGMCVYLNGQWAEIISTPEASPVQKAREQMQAIARKNEISEPHPWETRGDPNVTEYIICAANYYNDGEHHVHCPNNITEGFVTCGRRHHNCIMTFAQIVGTPYNDAAHKLQETEVQGFLTNTNRFVDRQEAYAIAFAANQIIGPNKGQPTNHIGLTSEDLY